MNYKLIFSLILGITSLYVLGYASSELMGFWYGVPTWVLSLLGCFAGLFGAVFTVLMEDKV